MSTRANVIIKDSFGQDIIFYRHSDGYPEGTEPTLKKFLQLVKDGTIRDNVSQASGWLVIIGHEEYRGKQLKFDCSGEKFKHSEVVIPLGLESFDHVDAGMSWKVGSYEPTTYISEDAEYLYTIDLEKKTLTTKEI